MLIQAIDVLKKIYQEKKSAALTSGKAKSPLSNTIREKRHRQKCLSYFYFSGAIQQATGTAVTIISSVDVSLQILNQRRPGLTALFVSVRKMLSLFLVKKRKMWLKEAGLGEKRLCLATKKETLHTSKVF